MSKRLKRVAISKESLTELLKTGMQYRIPEKRQTVTIVNGIPRTSRVIREHYDIHTNSYWLMLEDESFDEVKEGDIVPPMHITMQVNADE